MQFMLQLFQLLLPEVESRSQRSRPRLRTQKKIRGQGPTFREQTLSRPRVEMLEAKARDQGHNFSKNYDRQIFYDF